jgi:hypothetical protein
MQPRDGRAMAKGSIFPFGGEFSQRDHELRRQERRCDILGELAITFPGTFETCRMHRVMSEFEGKAENICSH